MCSSRSVTLSLVSQSQSCLLEGCKHFCCSRTGNCNGMYSEIYKKNKICIFVFNKISVIVCSRLLLKTNERLVTTLDVSSEKKPQILPIPLSLLSTVLSPQWISSRINCYLIAINLHDRRPSSISTSKVSHVTENRNWL